MAIANEIGLFPEIPGISWEQSLSHSEKVVVYSYNVYAYWFQLLKISSNDDNNGDVREIHVSETMQIFVSDVLSLYLLPLFQIATHDIELTNEDVGRANDDVGRANDGEADGGSDSSSASSTSDNEDDDEEQEEEEEGEEVEEEGEEKSQERTKAATEAFLMSFQIPLTYTDFCTMGIHTRVHECFEKLKSHSDQFNQKFFAKVTKAEPLAASKILTKKRKKKPKGNKVAGRNLNGAPSSSASASVAVPGAPSSSASASVAVPGAQASVLGDSGASHVADSGVLSGASRAFSPLSLSQSSTRFDNHSMIFQRHDDVGGEGFSTTSNVFFSQGSNNAAETQRMKQMIQELKVHHEQLLHDISLHQDLPNNIVEKITAFGKYLNP